MYVQRLVGVHCLGDCDEFADDGAWACGRPNYWKVAYRPDHWQELPEQPPVHRDPYWPAGR